MTDNELQKVLDAIKYIPSENERDEVTRIILKAAADSITLDKIKALTANAANAEDKVTTKQIEGMNGSEILVFSQKEINSIPKPFRKQFRCKGLMSHVHRQKSGKSNWNYEIRCQFSGIKVNVSSNSLEVAKQKFIKKIYEIDTYGEDYKEPSVPTAFDDFANYYFENFYKRKVVASTYRIGLNLRLVYTRE